MGDGERALIDIVVRVPGCIFVDDFAGRRGRLSGEERPRTLFLTVSLQILHFFHAFLGLLRQIGYMCSSHGLQLLGIRFCQIGFDHSDVDKLPKSFLVNVLKLLLNLIEFQVSELQMWLVRARILQLHLNGLLASDLQGKLKDFLSEALRENISLPLDEFELLPFQILVNLLIVCDQFALVNKSIDRVQKCQDSHQELILQECRLFLKVRVPSVDVWGQDVGLSDRLLGLVGE